MNSLNSEILNYLKADNIFETISAAADELSVETYIVGGYIVSLLLYMNFLQLGRGKVY